MTRSKPNRRERGSAHQGGKGKILKGAVKKSEPVRRLLGYRHGCGSSPICGRAAIDCPSRQH